MKNIMILESGERSVEVRLEGETVWLNLQQLDELFDRDKFVVSRHLRNIHATEELACEATVAKNATVQIEGSHEVQRAIEYYSSGASSICCAISPCSAPLLERTGGGGLVKIIAAATEAGLIKPDESVGKSRKFARYLPFWA
ncbi:MAG: hypothetical protein HZA65_03990 [Rhodocyclales bacterium]|nr:hypothetical protein [Rhodocyclales bacterium]